ncbi:MAG: hypothetical protein WKF75_00735 [Singulisphaera sp.]
MVDLTGGSAAAGEPPALDRRLDPHPLPALGDDPFARFYALPAGDAAARNGGSRAETLAEPTWAVVGRDGQVITRPVPITHPEFFENLTKIAQYHNTLRLDNTDPSNPLAGKVRLVLLRRAPDGTWIEAKPGADGRLVFFEKDQVGFRIINDHDEPVYVGVLDFGLTHRIHQIYPRRNAQPRHQHGVFDHGIRRQEIRLGTPRYFRRPRGPGVPQAYRLTEPADFRVLEQEATRGLDPKDLESLSPIERLMARAREGTRDAEESFSASVLWTTSLCPFILARSPAPPSL